MPDYVCAACGEEIDPELDIHSTPDGEDCHPDCCPVCDQSWRILHQRIETLRRGVD